MTRIAALVASFLLSLPISAQDPPIDPALYQAKEYRLIGPARGGRATSVAAVPGRPFTFYMGTSGGGLWKTNDAGTTWVNVSDGFFAAGSIGAVAVAPSDRNVVYAATGEACLRGDVQTGVGVYKSVDGGQTWRHVGPVDAGQIGALRVHPADPDRVYAAVLGHAFGPNAERGVYRTKDGGATWERVLFVSERAGAVDLAMDPQDPRVLYAAIYQVLRQPWGLTSGGEDSGLYKSTDGGDSWAELTAGLPSGIIGRLGVDVSPVDPRRVYVIAEAGADAGGLYRSDDAGNSFERVSRDPNLTTRPFNFSHVVAHPTDRDTVYVLNFFFHKSVDGGKTFDSDRGTHVDHHDLWIDPANPDVMIDANDGGATVTLNGGKSWSTQLNQPTSEIYRVDADHRFPYRLYGAQQDNSTISIASEPPPRGEFPDWYPVGGGEQGYVRASPKNPDVVYAAAYSGVLMRYDRATRQSRWIEVYPQLPEGVAAVDMKYRFQMNAPIEISPHDPDRVYFCSQYVHVTTDGGQSWRTISPDLTTDDESKQQPSGGPLTLDHTGPETYTTIFAFHESPHAAGLLWAGTDDGLVHLSRDGGEHWQNVTPRDLPEWGTVNEIELSPHGAGRAFLAVQRYRRDDFTPYVFRTDDYGRTWTRLATGHGIAPTHFVRVVREDPVRKGLLYAGTEFGMYVSFDDGAHWQSLQLNLPVVQVADLKVHEDDLVVATHGRAFWILDDLRLFRQLTPDVAAEDVHLFASEDVYRYRDYNVYFTLAAKPEEPPLLELLDAEGAVIRTFTQDDGVPYEAGMNHFAMAVHYPEAATVDGVIWSTENFGPPVPPGTYRVRLTLGDAVQERTFAVKPDPRVTATADDYRAQFDLALAIRGQLERAFAGVRRLRRAREQLRALAERLAEREELASRARGLAGRLTAIEDRLTQTRYGAYLDVCNYPPRLDSLMVYNLNAVYSADARPTDGSQQLYEEIEPRLAAILGDLDAVLGGELAAFNRSLREAGVLYVDVD